MKRALLRLSALALVLALPATALANGSTPPLFSSTSSTGVCGGCWGFDDGSGKP